MVVKAVVAVTVFLVVAITVVRGIRAADWLLMRQLPDQSWVQRGAALDHQVQCLDALASAGIAVPPGTKLRCERVTTTKEAKR